MPRPCCCAWCEKWCEVALGEMTLRALGKQVQVSTSLEHFNV
jgi:hypothetical protein